jgi:hypothetical protein
MSISVIKAPEQVAFAKNPVQFILQTNNYITTPATAAQIKLLWSSAPSNGDAFTLAWGNNSVTFTFVTGTPDNTGTQIQIPSFASPGFQDAIIAGLKTNYLLQKDFIFASASASGPKYGCAITAINKGTPYNVTVTESLSNLTTLIDTLAEDEVKQSNFAIIFEVFINNILVISFAQVPDINSKVTFDISEILQPYFSDDYPNTLGFSADITSDTGSNLINYVVRYAESYGDTPQIYTVSEYTATTLSVINGGFSKEDLLYAQAGIFFSTILPLNNQFLTWEPLVKRISPDQPDQLSWLSYSSSATHIQIKCKIYYNDGSTFNTGIIQSHSNTTGALYYIQTGLNDLGLNAIDPTKTILKYDVWLSGTNVFGITTFWTSQTRTYVVDYKERPYERIFLYRNSFGCYQSLRTIGEVQSKYKLTDSVSQRILPSDYIFSDFENKRQSVNADDVFTVATGYFPSKDWKIAFRDFLRSDSVFEFRDGNIIPIVILTLDDSFKDNDSLYSSKFDYKYSYSAEAFSNLADII